VSPSITKLRLSASSLLIRRPIAVGLGRNSVPSISRNLDRQVKALFCFPNTTTFILTSAFGKFTIPRNRLSEAVPPFAETSPY